MGRSFFRPTAANILEDYATHNHYYHPASDTHYVMIRRGENFFQRRYQIGYDGKETNIDEKQIDFVLGSGNHARTYLHRTPAGTLVQLPLAWYSEKGGYWAMSPGYDTPQHPDAQRPIGYDCMFCHNAYPQTKTVPDRVGDTPVFTGEMPEGINCERCHGPGQQHLLATQAPGASKAKIRQAILNPSRLGADRQMEVCLQCHLQPDSFRPTDEFKRYGRRYFSYDPRQPLSSFMLFFDKPELGADRFQIAGSGYRLRQSACYVKSAGALQCTTCHNPHAKRHGAEQRQSYNRVCQTCHSVTFQQRVAEGRHSSASNCIDCHMPARRTQDVTHVVMTDHYIQRRPPVGDLLAELDEKHEVQAATADAPIVPYYPHKLPPTPENRLAIAVVQVRGRRVSGEALGRLTQALRVANPPSADAYFEFAEAERMAGRLSAAVPLYKEAVRRDPKYVPAVVRLGTALYELGRSDEAAAVLQHGTEIMPDDASLWNAYGRLNVELGTADKATAALQKAIIGNPEQASPYIGLGILSTQRGELKRAEDNFREAIRIQPNAAEAHAALANLLFFEHDPEQAVWEYGRAIRANPGDASIRLGFATLLYSLQRSDAALEQVDAALIVNPTSADAHHIRGNILEQSGHLAESLDEYRKAVELHPGASRAQLDLGAVLLQTGDKAGALLHLKLASKADDPNVRRLALEMLKSINRE